MKVELARNKIIALVQWPKNIHIPTDRINQIDEVLESYARSNAIEFAAYVHKQTLDNPKGWIKGRLDAKIYDTWKKGGE